MIIKRKYTEQFIRDAVELTIKSDKSMTQVAKSLGLPTTTLRQWMGPPKKDYKKFQGKAPVNNDPLERQLLDMKRELADVKLERDILKKAVAIFSKPQE